MRVSIPVVRETVVRSTRSIAGLPETLPTSDSSRPGPAIAGRRSTSDPYATPSPTCAGDHADLLETSEGLARERIEIAVILAHPPESFAEVRAALNELHRTLR